MHVRFCFHQAHQTRVSRWLMFHWIPTLIGMTKFDEVTHSEHFCNFDCHRWLLAFYRAVEFVPNHIVQWNRATSKRIEIVFFVDVRGCCARCFKRWNKTKNICNSFFQFSECECSILHFISSTCHFRFSVFSGGQPPHLNHGLSALQS